MKMTRSMPEGTNPCTLASIYEKGTCLIKVFRSLQTTGLTINAENTVANACHQRHSNSVALLRSGETRHASSSTLVARKQT